MTGTIKTNNLPRDTFYIWQLDDKDQNKIRKQFDYYTKEYDYLTSKEQIIATIRANEYNFTEDGSRTVTL